MTQETDPPRKRRRASDGVVPPLIGHEPFVPHSRRGFESLEEPPERPEGAPERPDEAPAPPDPKIKPR